MNTERERGVISAFVGIAKSLTEGYDIVELYTELTTDCVRLLDIASAGLLLADGLGVLHLMAASSERAHDIETFQLQRHEGPCLDCFRGGAPVLVDDLAAAEQRWPQFVPAALSAGFTSVHALPMRLQDTVLGALGLFSTETGRLTDDDLHLGQALAATASLALVAERSSADKDALNAQLHTALQSRVVLEQAKGLIAQSGSLDMEQAFDVLRRYARDHNEKLSHVAAQTVERTLPAGVILDHARRKGIAGLTE
ncbi:MAG TPA: GAF and ANTAR domain-containing protein [Sporichthyaceae bacterium]|nr:GAF and ANTAR domain-containing protein [Sporichthyaceae bacterium]